mmetsp:Transcript_30224/g.78366  ORF Transcript_30224/g.78366 Transcript_30224/m.78366 type:complete len:121 (+) Transcript_30224:219-581(+)
MDLLFPLSSSASRQRICAHQSSQITRHSLDCPSPPPRVGQDVVVVVVAPCMAQSSVLLSRALCALFEHQLSSELGILWHGRVFEPERHLKALLQWLQPSGGTLRPQLEAEFVAAGRAVRA